MSGGFVKPLAQYAAKSKDDAVRMKSTSGGVFTELARVVLAYGGVVVGAGWEKNPLRVVHKVARNESQLVEMRGAKYVFSDMGDCISEVDSALKAGKVVLFTGTPCQTAAMRKKYGNLNNLLLCAVICHSTPERDVWDAYVEYLENSMKSRIARVQFRNKGKGWRKSLFVADFEDLGKSLCEPLSENLFARIYFSGVAQRQPCSHCRFRCGLGGADLMVGDFWGIEDCHPEWDDGKGVSAVIVYSKIGETFLRAATLDLLPVAYRQILAKNPHIEISPLLDEAQRMRFMSLYRKVGVARAFRIATKTPIYKRIFRYSYRIAMRFLHSR